MQDASSLFAQGGNTTEAPAFLGRSLPQHAVEASLGLHDLPLRVLAHLGDGVYELLLREWVMWTFPNASVKVIHEESIRLACGAFQATLLQVLLPDLSEAEQEILRRGRNVGVANHRRNKQAISRLSTSFEALVGFWYLHDPQRLALLKQSLWQVANLSAEAYQQLSLSFQDIEPLPVEQPSPVVKKALFQNLKKSKNTSS
jgi:ribonuclease III family protein